MAGRSPAPGTQIAVPPGLGLSYVRVNTAGDEPPPEKGLVDVAVLDMHHGYANLGHASIVESLLNYAHDFRQRHPGAPPVRVISYDVRAGLAVRMAVLQELLVARRALEVVA